MLSRRCTIVVILLSALVVSGSERTPQLNQPAQPKPGDPDVPVPPPGWVKDRLAAVDRKLDGEIKDLVALYQHLHANPELSLMETKTAARLADEMRKLGCEVTEKVGGTGVVAVLAPQRSSLLGLVSVVAPVIVTGNTCVVAASYERPLPAITLSEVLATSDVPGGVVNILTGRVGDTAPWLASHMDVNAIDLTGAAGDTEHAAQLEEAAAENLKRVARAPAEEPDWREDPGITRMTRFLETKTVWHPIGV